MHGRSHAHLSITYALVSAANKDQTGTCYTPPLHFNQSSSDSTAKCVLISRLCLKMASLARFQRPTRLHENDTLFYVHCNLFAVSSYAESYGIIESNATVKLPA